MCADIRNRNADLGNQRQRTKSRVNALGSGEYFPRPRRRVPAFFVRDAFSFAADGKEFGFAWLAQVYASLKPPSGNGRLLWHALGAKTIELIHQTVKIAAHGKRARVTVQSTQASEGSSANLKVDDSSDDSAFWTKSGRAVAFGAGLGSSLTGCRGCLVGSDECETMVLASVVSKFEFALRAGQENREPAVDLSAS